MATIRKRNAKFQVQIRRQGFTASRTFILRKDAQAWARQTEVKTDRRGADLPPDPSVLNGMTLHDLVTRYRDEVTPKKEGSETERIVLTAFLRHDICNRQLLDLRPEHFVKYRDERLREITPATLKRQLTPIRSMFKLARREWGLPVSNPLADVELKAIDVRRERRLRNGEYDRLVQSAISSRNPFILPIIVFAVETGMRRGEIVYARWKDFDPDGRTLHIPKTKNGHPRTIPLSRRAIEILSVLPRTETQPRIFPVSPNAFRLAWERTTERAGISDLHFHDLRHEAISRFFERGLTMPEVQMISGHRDVRMLLRYAHAQRQIVQNKLDRQ